MEPQELLEGESELSPFRMDDVEHELLAANFDVAHGKPEIRAASISILKSRLQNDYGGHRGARPACRRDVQHRVVAPDNLQLDSIDQRLYLEQRICSASCGSDSSPPGGADRRVAATRAEGFSERERPMMQISSGGCDGERSSIAQPPRVAWIQRPRRAWHSNNYPERRQVGDESRSRAVSISGRLHDSASWARVGSPQQGRLAIAFSRPRVFRRAQCVGPDRVYHRFREASDARAGVVGVAHFRKESRTN